MYCQVGMENFFRIILNGRWGDIFSVVSIKMCYNFYL